MPQVTLTRVAPQPETNTTAILVNIDGVDYPATLGADGVLAVQLAPVAEDAPAFEAAVRAALEAVVPPIAPVAVTWLAVAPKEEPPASKEEPPAPKEEPKPEEPAPAVKAEEADAVKADPVAKENPDSAGAGAEETDDEESFFEPAGAPRGMPAVRLGGDHGANVSAITASQIKQLGDAGDAPVLGEPKEPPPAAPTATVHADRAAPAHVVPPHVAADLTTVFPGSSQLAATVQTPEEAAAAAAAALSASLGFDDEKAARLAEAVTTAVAEIAEEA